MAVTFSCTGPSTEVLGYALPCLDGVTRDDRIFGSSSLDEAKREAEFHSLACTVCAIAEYAPTPIYPESRVDPIRFSSANAIAILDALHYRIDAPRSERLVGSVIGAHLAADIDVFLTAHPELASRGPILGYGGRTGKYMHDRVTDLRSLAARAAKDEASVVWQ